MKRKNRVTITVGNKNKYPEKKRKLVFPDGTESVKTLCLYCRHVGPMTFRLDKKAWVCNGRRCGHLYYTTHWVIKDVVRKRKSEDVDQGLSQSSRDFLRWIHKVLAEIAEQGRVGMQKQPSMIH